VDVPSGRRDAARSSILTVDDDPAVSRAVARDLRRRYGDAHRIVRAESGEQALTALREMKLRGETVAVLLADSRRPRLQLRVDDGVQLLLRRVPRLEEVVVEVDDVDRVDGGVGVGIGGQQDPPARRVQVHRGFEELQGPVGQGTGLGLDISWRIVVNKHHGDLSVQSAPGDTRFVVRLPLRDHQEDPS
jgi:CheY-like chemotaxis protein